MNQERRISDKEINDRIKEEILRDKDFVYISSKYPMSSDGYELLEQIGMGMNYNKVFMADCKTGDKERVAIKQIDLSQQSKETKEKITKEVMGMSLVQASEYVVQFHCSFVNEETLWIVMDLQEGSVRDVLKCKYNQGIDDEVIIATIIYQTLHGIKFLHEQNMIHRDIKAGNILFNKEGNIKLADFGVSAILASNDEKRQTMVGTWHWMAPEVIDPGDCGGYDFKADIWSLGITCIELAYGVAPYSEVKPPQVIIYIMQNEPPTLDVPHVPPSPSISKSYSNNFKEFVAKCLKRDPKERPTAERMLQHRFFSKTSQTPRMRKALMDNLPSLGERFKINEEMRKNIRVAQANRAGLRIANSNRNLMTQTEQQNPTGVQREIETKSPRNSED